MKKLLSLILLLLLNLTSTIQASTTEEISDYQKQLEENQKKQQELQQKIEGLQAEERSLQNQIDYMDSQIALTNLKIDEAQTKILERQRELEGLVTDIETLIARIKRIEESVRYQNEVYGQRLRARYKSSKVSALEILFGADSLSDVFARLKYLRMMEQQDRRLISQMNETQFNYKNQKALLEETKKQVEIVKAELEQEKANLEARRADLDFQKRAKEELLAITQNDEARFQEILATLRAEERAIKEALSQVFKDIIAGAAEGTEIGKGDMIGLEGDTGYVIPSREDCVVKMGLPSYCGAHLHFMVLTCGDFSCHTDPAPYLDNGDFGMPMNFTSPWREYLSQPYGITACTRSGICGYRFHTGIDLVLEYEAPILAVKDGTLYYGIDARGAHYAVIKHSADLYTAYWHLK